MKARVKATGEVIELDETNVSMLDYVRGIYKSKSGGAKYKSRELEFMQEQRKSDTDWQQVRIQAAIAAVGGITANETFFQLEGILDGDEPDYEKWAARVSVKIADALVAELKKK